MERLIYSKSSIDRNKAFAIVTNIYRNGEEILVKKKPVFSEGLEHLRKIPEYYRELDNAFRGSKIRIQPVEYSGEACVFKFITGQTLEERVNALLEKNEYERAFSEIEGFFALIREKCTNRKFEYTEAFKQIFGTEDIPDNALCADLNNIDYGLGNIILFEDQLWLIDYEWCFSFPIPIDYILFRALLYFVYMNQKSKELLDRQVFGRFGYNETDIEKYTRMEKAFQQYISQNTVSLSRLKDHMLQKTLHIHELYTGRDQKITELNGTIEQKENYINEQREWLSERDQRITELNGTIEQKENYINEQREWLSERDHRIMNLQGITDNIGQNLQAAVKDREVSQAQLINYLPGFLNKGVIQRLFQVYTKVRMRKNAD